MHYGYIGLGNLGGHLAHSLIKKGYKVTVYDLDPKLAERHVRDGATLAASPAELAGQVDVVFTCLPSPTVSEKVLSQILTTLKPGSTWIRTPPTAATRWSGLPPWRRPRASRFWKPR